MDRGRESVCLFGCKDSVGKLRGSTESEPGGGVLENQSGGAGEREPFGEAGHE